MFNFSRTHVVIQAVKLPAVFAWIVCFLLSVYFSPLKLLSSSRNINPSEAKLGT